MSLAGLDNLPATFSYQQAMAAGLTHHRLYGLRDSRELEQIGRGLYRKAAAELTDLDLLEAAQRAPHSTICLLSALARHDLTDAIPPRHDIALPRDAWHTLDSDRSSTGIASTPRGSTSGGPTQILRAAASGSPEHGPETRARFDPEPRCRHQVRQLFARTAHAPHAHPIRPLQEDVS